VSLDKVVVNGEPDLSSISVKGDLLFTSGRLNNPKHAALSLDTADMGGDVALDQNFSSEGEVRLVGAHIAGDRKSVRNRTDKR
jgi:hypothetical protein